MNAQTFLRQRRPTRRRGYLTVAAPVDLIPLLSLVMLASLIGCGRAQAQVRQPQWTDEMFDQWIFQQDRTPWGARQRLDSLLALRIEEVDRACRLTDAQKKKLQLAGGGDVKRFFDRYDTVKRKFHLLKNDQQKMNQIWQDISPLQMSLQTGLFQEDSFLLKVLPKVLTREQSARYEVVARQRLAFRHRVAIEQTVAILEQNIPLREAQRRQLIALLTSQTKPARKSGQYEYWVILVQLGRVPEEKLKTLFDNMQWRVVTRHIEQAKRMEPYFRQIGQWPDVDDEADKADARPAAVKK